MVVSVSSVPSFCLLPLCACSLVTVHRATEPACVASAIEVCAGDDVVGMVMMAQRYRAKSEHGVKPPVSYVTEAKWSTC